MVEPLRRWEYRVEDEAPAGRLNELGKDGWELVTNADGLIFRRPLLSFVERVTMEQRATYYRSRGLDPEANS